MLIFAVMAVGSVSVLVAWRIVAVGKATVWVAMACVLGGAGLAALATGRVNLTPRVRWWVSAGAGIAAGLLLYLATAAFVLVVRRWPVFDRHVAEIYDQRKGL